jgi:hypothetical protein
MFKVPAVCSTFHDLVKVLVGSILFCEIVDNGRVFLSLPPLLCTPSVIEMDGEGDEAALITLL